MAGRSDPFRPKRPAHDVIAIGRGTRIERDVIGYERVRTGAYMASATDGAPNR
jgi:hypothetical protein